MRIVDGEIYIVDEVAIRVYDATADGDVAPLRVITGPDAGVSAVIGVDVVGGEVYSANIASPNQGIHVHPRNSTSDAAPVRSISGPMSTIKSPRFIAIY
jgi:hypothetical protein